MSVRRVVGRRDGDGRPLFGDVVGDLVRLDASVAVVETRDGPVEIAVDTVSIAKPAPPSTADELALEAVAAAGWRAGETAELGGWLLRATAGFTGRANSVLPLRAPGMALDEALQRASDWYAARDLPLRILVPTEARRLLDAELGERGWPAEGDVHVMAARLDQLRADVRPDVPVRLDDAPDEGWFARYRDGAGVSEHARALLTRHDHAVFASVRDDERVLAIARGTIDDGWLGVTAVEVDPVHRNAGLAQAVSAALFDWGRRNHATRSYLQVSADNTPAVALYRKLGYWVHHDYRYRTEPVP